MSLSFPHSMKVAGGECCMGVLRNDLRTYSDKPVNICASARQMFGKNKSRTIVVEGDNDRRFLGNWLSGCRFHVCKGKSFVIETYRYYKSNKNKYNSNVPFIYFIADLDFDLITKKDIIVDDCFIYNSLCSVQSYNDMEAFLVSTPSFEKVLSNFDVGANEASSLRHKLRRASSVLGSFRAADLLVQKEGGIRRSVLNGFDFYPYFDPKDVCVDPCSIESGIRRHLCSDRGRVDSLIIKAKCLRDEHSEGWGLSRGHDITELLSLYIRDGLSKRHGDLEMLLRVACERVYFESSPVGKSLRRIGLLP